MKKNESMKIFFHGLSLSAWRFQDSVKMHEGMNIIQ